LANAGVWATFNTSWSQTAKALTISIGSDVGNLDPDKYTNWNNYWAYGNMFEGLFRPDAKGGLVPALAEKHESSADERSHKFMLRATKFHNSDPVTTDDFISRLHDRAIRQYRISVPACSTISSASNATTRRASSSLRIKIGSSLINNPVAQCDIG